MGLWEQADICVQSFYPSKRLTLPNFYLSSDLFCAALGRIRIIRLSQLILALSSWLGLILLGLTKDISTYPNLELQLTG